MTGPPRAARYGSEPGPLVIAHRGGAGIGPENTDETFQRAVDLGFNHLETDVQVTSDGVCVAFHDRETARLTRRAGRISAMTWGEVRRLRVLGGGRVPALQDLLTGWPDVCWLLDVKQPQALPAILSVIRATGAVHRVCLTGTWGRWITAAKAELGPDLTTGLGWEATFRLLCGLGVGDTGATFVHVPLRIGTAPVVTPRLVESVHRRGLRLLVWGVNGLDHAGRLLGQGVDGFITDRPDVLRPFVPARLRPAGSAAPSQHC